VVPSAEVAAGGASAPAAAVRLETVVQVAGALVQSPRFASRITDERQQDLMVRLAVSLADRILAAVQAF